MTTISTAQFKKGMYIMHRGEPRQIVGVTFVSPGKGSAFYRTKLKSLKTGSQIEYTFKSGERVEEVFVETSEANYAYFDGNSYVFIEPRSFEQFEVPQGVVGEDKIFLKEGKPYRIRFYEGRAVEVVLPKNIVCQVVETENAIKGDTATGAVKPATLDTGMVIQVPLFIKKGDRVSVSTETGQYLERK